LSDAGFRIIAMDARGHGQSGKPHDPAAYGAEMADDVARLLDHLKIPRAHVLGYSMGGDIANKLLERHPNRVTSVILGGIGRYPTNNWAAVDYDIRQLADSLERGQETFDFFLQPLSLEHPALSRAEAEAMNAWVMSHNDPLALAAMIRGYERLAVSATSLEKNTVPALAVVGQFDPERPDVDELKKVMNSLQVKVIDGTTHFTAAWDPRFVDISLDFLERHRSNR
jgi:pimeloyl-ACP methyl ester carboxylesterase